MAKCLNHNSFVRRWGYNQHTISSKCNKHVHKMSKWQWGMVFFITTVFCSCNPEITALKMDGWVLLCYPFFSRPWSSHLSTHLLLFYSKPHFYYTDVKLQHNETDHQLSVMLIAQNHDTEPFMYLFCTASCCHWAFLFVFAVGPQHLRKQYWQDLMERRVRSRTMERRKARTSRL